MKTNLKKFFTLSFMIMFQWGLAQTSVSGTVSDSSGVPLPGATVIVAGTSNGVTTDFDGVYSISASEGDVLSISYVGFVTQNVTIGASATVNVSLVADNALEEVVVTALGISRDKKSIGFSQQTVAGDVLATAKETDLNVALTGKVAGVQMIGGSSSTFDNGYLRLRGEDNLLYVVDGIKVYSMTDINTDNVESISVLKGAAATALYGADAQSGVIVITSKKAKAGESFFTIDHSTTLSNVSILPEYQNEYGGGYYQSWDTFSYNPAIDPSSWAAFNGQNIPYYAADESWGPKLDGTLARHWDSWIPGHPEFGTVRPWEANPNNVKDFYDTGIENSTSLSFNSGGEKYGMRSSARFVDQTLPYPGTERNQLDFGINQTLEINDKLSAYSALNIQLRKTVNFPEQGYGGLGANFNQWFQRQLDMDRLRDNYNYNGGIYSWNRNSARNATPLFWDAPHFSVNDNRNTQNKEVFFGNLGLNYQINDDFAANVEVRRRSNTYSRNNRTGWGGVNTESYGEGRSNYEENEFEARLNYAKDYGDFDVNALVGYQVTQTGSTSLSSSSVGGLTIPGFYSVASSKDRPSYSSTESNKKQISTFSSVSVGYKSMLYLDGSYRLDWGSTANPDDNRIETFGLSGSFIFDKLINVDAISFAKLRAGYSEAPVFPGVYQTSKVYGTGTAHGSKPRFNVPNTLANPYLTGGTRSEFEVGTEVSFLNNRLGFDLTYYDRVDEDLPISIPVPGSTGYSGLSINSGASSTSGVELTLNATPIQSEDFRWDVSFNIASIKKVTDKLYDGINSRVLDYMSWYSLQLQERVGEEWGTFVGRAPRTDDNGTPIYSASGRTQYEGNQVLGNILPDYTGGFSTSFAYKNWNLDAGFDFQSGGLFSSTSNMFAYYSGMHMDTIGLNDKGNPKRDAVSAGGGVHVVGVTSGGDPVDVYQSASTHFYTNYFGNHPNWLYDASYVKLRTLRIGYDFPKSMLENTNFSDINISVIGNNLLLLYSNIPEGGLDPSEIEGSGSLASSYRSQEGGQLPPARTIGLNLSLKF